MSSTKRKRTCLGEDRGFNSFKSEQLLITIQNAAKKSTVLLRPRPVSKFDDNFTVQRLLKSGADPNILDNDGKTCLHYVAKYNFSASDEIVELLLSAGASADIVDNKGNTPLLLAASSEHENTRVFEKLIKARVDVNRNDFRGCTSLQYAVQLGKTSFVRCLLAAGASLPDPDENCGYGFENLVKYGRVDEARLYLEYGLDLSRYNPQNSHDFSPLHAAIGSAKGHYYDKSDMLSLLLKYNNGILDLEHENESGKSPLSFAAWCMSPKSVELLISVGADIEHADANDRTPLEVVAIDCLWKSYDFRSDRCEQCIRLLVKAGAKLRRVLNMPLPDTCRPHVIVPVDVKLCFAIAKQIVKYRVLYESQKSSVEEPIENGYMGESKKLRSYLEACQVEISLLKSTPLNSSINYYEILIASKDFYKRVRDQQVYETFDEANLESRFPVYARELSKNFKSLKKMHEIWERAVTNLALLFRLNSVVYYSIIRNILDLFDKNDVLSTARLHTNSKKDLVFP
ncbi:hypothetical protein QAD02_001149 [Eretmocerus hayati]|uniref:Uncharacterized protein n=1 Tax=Eretmocerus hayati TaxID=131215 RepID=A0ACC2NFE8_9HYME|nr:hypothetical protein QAD02_001149 [Eretmocerus hayati]